MTATNSAGSATSTAQSVTVVVAPTSVTVNGPDSQVVGTAYQATSASSGADVATTYSLASGAPSWLSIDPSSGDISGTIPEGNPPYYGYSVTATDSDGSATSSEQFVTIASGNSAVSLSPEGTCVPAGTPITFTASVSETSGSGALTGTVSFTNGNKKVSGCTNLSLSASDKAKCSITFPAVGNYNVTATYGERPVLQRVVRLDPRAGRQREHARVHVGCEHDDHGGHCFQLQRERHRESGAQPHRVRRARPRA